MSTYAALVVRNKYNNLWICLSIKYDGMDLFDNLFSGEWTYNEILLTATHVCVSSLGKSIETTSFYQDEDNALCYMTKDEAIEMAVKSCSYVAAVDIDERIGYSVTVVEDGDGRYQAGFQQSWPDRC